LDPRPGFTDHSWKAVVETAKPVEVEGYLAVEVFKAFNLPPDSPWRTWLAFIARRIVRNFALKAAIFDESVARHGFKETAHEWLGKWTTGIKVNGLEYLPEDGPLLIVANHPGTYDGLAIASVIPRQDLKIIVSGNPFFRSLPNVRQHFIFSTLDRHVRMTVIRTALRHLRDGGALLIFPSGRVDPEPSFFYEEAAESLLNWSDSIEMILQKVPQTRLVLTINSQFIAPAYMQNPLTKFQRGYAGRQKIAEFLQVMQQVLFDKRIACQPVVSFSKSVMYSELIEDGRGFHNAISTRARELLQSATSGQVRQSST
jgi:hypothetical protein